MRLALILAWQLLHFVVPSHHAAPGCAQGMLVGTNYCGFHYADLECGRDSLHWTLASRWGMSGVRPGDQVVVLAWPDSTMHYWRLTIYNAVDSASCPSAAVHK